MAKHGKAYAGRRAALRPRARVRARRGDRARQAAVAAPSSTSRSRCTSAPASTSATPTSSCAARSRCPNGLGKDVKIAVFAQGDKAREAEEAGADVVGAEDLAKQIQEGFDDFDVAIATPDLMPVVGRLGRILGPAGKMPNPKVGTVTMDVAKAVEESKAGKVEYRTDRTAIVHLVIGKRDFDERLPARELRGGDRGADPRQAVRGQGPLHPLGHVRLDDGPRRQGRPDRARATSSRRPSPPRSAGRLESFQPDETKPETSGATRVSPEQAEPRTLPGPPAVACVSTPA